MKIGMTGRFFPAILEISGTPWSGGFGQDTDRALIESRRFLLDVCAPDR